MPLLQTLVWGRIFVLLFGDMDSCGATCIVYVLSLMEDAASRGFKSYSQDSVSLKGDQSNAGHSGLIQTSGFGDVLNGQRRSEYDVSDTVCVSDAARVCQAVKQLLGSSISSGKFQVIEDGFDILDMLYTGGNVLYHGCETDYHNKQHVLDVTLAAARLIWGYQQQASNTELFSDDDIITGLLVAIFHDVGYLREKSETAVSHGAEFTKVHVSRGADFLDHLFKTLGYGRFSAEGQALVHFTGYEKEIEEIEVSSIKLKKLGYLIGTADVIAQMADRTYLEKCENFLYSEFLLGGMCVQKDAAGRTQVVYSSARELMEKTPQFMSSVLRNRLTLAFDSSYHFAEACFDGVNLYLLNINKNYSYLNEQLHQQKHDETSVLLRRDIRSK